MNRISISFCTALVAGFASAPGAAVADEELDDLDVTMEVLDDESEFSELANQMRGPDTSGIEDFTDDSADAADADVPGDDAEVNERPLFTDDRGAQGDGFDRDATLPEDQLRHEDDFEDDEGEDRDLDIPIEMDYPDEEYPHEP
ncbi:MAG TPA: hypothetical protein PKK10_14690 [Woeseiaceae bacterium]|nr:hypothetical protein [Woeseiaceae bacterium]